MATRLSFWVWFGGLDWTGQDWTGPGRACSAQPSPARGERKAILTLTKSAHQTRRQQQHSGALSGAMCGWLTIDGVGGGNKGLLLRPRRLGCSARWANWTRGRAGPYCSIPSFVFCPAWAGARAGRPPAPRRPALARARVWHPNRPRPSREWPGVAHQCEPLPLESSVAAGF